MVSRLRYFIGYFGELLILAYLMLKWYNVIKRRYRCKFGEIDLIVSKKKELVFIEVKTSLLGKEILISHLQCQSIINSSKYFLNFHYFKLKGKCFCGVSYYLIKKIYRWCINSKPVRRTNDNTIIN